MYTDFLFTFITHAVSKFQHLFLFITNRIIFEKEGIRF